MLQTCEIKLFILIKKWDCKLLFTSIANSLVIAILIIAKTDTSILVKYNPR